MTCEPIAKGILCSDDGEARHVLLHGAPLLVMAGHPVEASCKMFKHYPTGGLFYHPNSLWVLLTQALTVLLMRILYLMTRLLLVFAMWPVIRV